MHFLHPRSSLLLKLGMICFFRVYELAHIIQAWRGGIQATYNLNPLFLVSIDFWLYKFLILTGNI